MSSQEDFTSDEVVNGGFKNGSGVGKGEAKHAVTDSTNSGASVTNGGSSIDDRKLFVGGLSWETTEPDLAEYFGQFGDLEAVDLKMDLMTGRSRCFAFLLFKTSHDVDKILSRKEHVVSNKKIDVKRAKAKPGKIYVGGLPDELTEEAIRDYFTANYGIVAEIESPYDKERQRRKNFCFVTFEREEVLREVLANSRQKIGEFTVDVKKASPRPKMPMMMMPPFWGPYNGYYGGYGPPYGGYYDYSGYYGGGGGSWGGGGTEGEGAAGGGGEQATSGASDAAASAGETAAPGGGKMSRESGGGSRVTPY